MRYLKMIGSSFVVLYLACALLAAYSIGNSVPAVAANSAAISQAVKVLEVKVPAAEQDESVIAATADAIPDWMEILTTIIALAGVITAATPSPKDNVVLGVVRKVLDVFALNIGGARNASATKDKTKTIW